MAQFFSHFILSMVALLFRLNSMTLFVIVKIGNIQFLEWECKDKTKKKKWLSDENSFEIRQTAIDREIWEYCFLVVASNMWASDKWIPLFSFNWFGTSSPLHMRILCHFCDTRWPIHVCVLRLCVFSARYKSWTFKHKTTNLLNSAVCAIQAQVSVKFV